MREFLQHESHKSLTETKNIGNVYIVQEQQKKKCAMNKWNGIKIVQMIEGQIIGNASLSWQFCMENKRMLYLMFILPFMGIFLSLFISGRIKGMG